MRNTLAALTCISFLISAPEQASGFDGFYTGIIGGSARQQISYPNDPLEPLSIAGYYPSKINLGISGGSIGSLVGYGLTRNQWYLGIEADFNFAFAKSSSTSSMATLPWGNVPPPGFNGTYPGYSFNASTDLNWYSTTRARIGWAPSGQSLIYATFGVGAASYSTNASIRFVGPWGNPTYDSEKVRVGIAMGGGIEFALSPEWRLRGEYLYVGLNSYDVSLVERWSLGGQISYRLDPSFQTFRAAIVYAF